MVREGLEHRAEAQRVVHGAAAGMGNREVPGQLGLHRRRGVPALDARLPLELLVEDHGTQVHEHDGIDAGAGLDGLGPSGTGSHTVEETVNLNSIQRASKRAALLIYRLTRD